MIAEVVAGSIVDDQDLDIGIVIADPIDHHDRFGNGQIERSGVSGSGESSRDFPWLWSPKLVISLLQLLVSSVLGYVR